MTGLQRFCMLLICVGVMMVLYPDTGASVWSFAGAIILVWLGAILILGIIGSLFGLYRFDGINRLLTFLLFCGIMYSLLWYFPQEDGVSPINKLKYGQFPTGADIQRGIQKMTFNFAFDKRNARSEKNFVNQQDPKALAEEAAKKEAEEAARKAAEKARQKLEIKLDE